VLFLKFCIKKDSEALCAGPLGRSCVALRTAELHWNSFLQKAMAP
jgi:hypothetical protein